MSETIQRLRVMLVDDTPDVRLLVRTLVAARAGLEVVAEADNGEQAVALAAALRPDVIVLDVAMPVLDGIAALPRLRQASPESRVVVLSALPSHSQASAALAAGAAAYIEKSVPADRLIDELLQGAQLLDAAVAALTRQQRQNFAAETQSVSAARNFVRATLTEWNEIEVLDTITLLISELVTNAVVHANAAPDVTVRLLADRVHVEVLDSHSELVTPRALTDTAPDGRGLALVDILAMNWGNVQIAGGKVVWFDVARTRAA